MIREAILERYEHIIYFDPDVVWLGDPLPCPDTIFGMTWHDFEQGHYNNGACYINNKGFQAYWPVEEWWARPDEGHKWSGQHSMNLTLVDHPERVTRLDHKWNAVQRMPQYHSPNPSVLAWHGTYGDCLFEMAQTVEAAAKKQMLSLGNINPYTGTR